MGRDKVVTKAPGTRSAKARTDGKAFDRWLTQRLGDLNRQMEAEPLPVALRRIAAKALKPAK